MRRTHLVLTISVAIFSVLATQLSISAATIEMTMVTETPEGTVTERSDVPLYYVADAEGYGRYHIGYSSYDRGYVWETDEGKIKLKGVLDPDPMMSFAGAAIDFGTPSNFSFLFTMGLIPNYSNPSSVVKDSFSGSVTNAAGSGVTVTALPPPAGIPVDADGVTEIEVYTLSDDNMATWKNVGLDLMPTTVVPLAVGGSALTPSFNAGPIPTIAGGPWTHMRADVNFRLTGGGDIFTFNGAKVLVPEPGPALIALLNLAMLCCLKRRSGR